MILAETGKNLKELVRLERTEYKGHQLLSIRAYYQAADGEWKPTAKGITMKAESWQGIVPALMLALAGGDS